MISIVLIGLSLAMDAFAISISYGLANRDFRLRHALTMSLYFGAFQFLMPLLGCFLAGTVSGYISRFGPYISCGLLAFIGIRMIVEACKKSEEEEEETVVDLSPSKMLALAVATSIDALAVGVSFAFMEDVSLIPSCLVIGIVTFCVCTIGGMAGSRIPGIKGKVAEILGGCILLGIGVKLLIQGLM